MTELILVSKQDRSLRPLVEAALANELRLVEAAIRQTEQRIQEFETAYHMETEEFISRFENDELEETLDFVDWVGESKILSLVRDKVETFQGTSLRIEAYFRKFQDAVDASPVVRSTRLTYDKRSSFEGYIRGELYFIDESSLHVREYVSVEGSVDRLTYAYQYMNADKELIFRYDNSGHHRKLHLATYPHHKHDGSEDKVVESPGPTLAQTLNEIEKLIFTHF
jgi:hypothetical protein